MLTVKDMGSSQATYYTRLAKEDYYTKGQEPYGVWIGTGAEKLGLSGTIKEEELKNVYNGFSPDGKEKLVQNAGRMNDKFSRDPGWDLTFSAPKSVSILHAISDEKMKAEIEKAHFEAIRAVSKNIEAKTVIRKGKGGKIREQAGLVIATYQHGTSRAVDKNTLPDMQLHTHTLVLNVGVSPSDGKTRSITSYQLYQKEKFWGAAYRVELSNNLNAIGFQTERTRDSFEVKGVPQLLIYEFSKRTGQIEEQTKGISDPKEKEKIKLEGRTVKDTYDRAELLAHWSKKCAEFGLTQEKVRELAGHRPDAKRLALEEQEAIKIAISNLQKEKPTFTADELQRAVMVEAQARGIGFVEATQATHDYIRFRAKYQGKEGYKSLFTTPEKAVELINKKHNKESQEIKELKKNLENTGKKVLGVSISKKSGTKFQKKTGIETLSVNQLVQKYRSDGNRKWSNLLNGDTSATEVINKFKYATRQISKRQMKYLNRDFVKPTSKFMHKFKYATGQISKKQMKYLDAELKRKNFNKIDSKTIIVIPAKREHFASYSKARVLFEDLERLGAKIYTAEEFRNLNKTQQQTPEKQEKKQEQSQDFTQELAQRR